jgi:hypothetical protein
MKSATEDDMLGTIINPYYAIVFKGDLFGKHEIEGAKEDWVQKNAQLVQEIGSRDWLNELLLAFSADSKPDHVRDILINPYEGIVFSQRLQGDHPPLITREMWIQANEKLMDEIGVESWLYKLLDVLETGKVLARG